MFESKKWYREVTILTVITTVMTFVVGFVIGFVLGLLGQGYLVDTGIFDVYAGLIAPMVFMGLAIWRIYKKVLKGKEALVLFLISFGINFGMSFLFPYYTQFPLSIVLVYLIIWRIHDKSVRKISHQYFTTPDFG